MQMNQQLIKILARPFLVIGLTWTGVCAAQAEVTSDRDITTVRCGSVIDGISEQALGPRTLGIQSGRIVFITETPPENVVDLDLTDYTCLPGLINTHRTSTRTQRMRPTTASMRVARKPTTWH